MKDVDSISPSLRENEKLALRKLSKDIGVLYPDAEIILFGSRARGEGTHESDLDILILISHAVDEKVSNSINDVSYPIELEYDVVFGKIIEEKSKWNSPIYKVLPLHQNVDREGIRL